MFQVQMPAKNPYLQGIAAANQFYNDAALTPAKRKLALAQAQAAKRPKATPYSNAMQLFSAYKAAPEGSDMQKMLEALINKQVSSSNGMSIAMPNGQTIQIGGGTSANLFGNNNTTSADSVNPTSISRRSMKGAQVARKNKDGSVTVNQSPTTSTTGKLQQRQLGDAESNVITPDVTKGIHDFSGFGATPGLLWNVMLAKRGDPEAQQKVRSYLLARQLNPELALMRARQAGITRPGTEVQRHYENVIWPHSPDNWAMGFVPSNMQSNSVSQAQQEMNRAVNAAGQESANNFPIIMAQPPYWAPGNASSPQQNVQPPMRAPVQPPMRQAMPQSPQTSRKTISQATLDAFAKEKGVSPAVLKKELMKKGITING